MATVNNFRVQFEENWAISKILDESLLTFLNIRPRRNLFLINRIIMNKNVHNLLKRENSVRLLMWSVPVPVYRPHLCIWNAGNETIAFLIYLRFCPRLSKVAQGRYNKWGILLILTNWSQQMTKVVNETWFLRKDHITHSIYRFVNTSECVSLWKIIKVLIIEGSSHSHRVLQVHQYPKEKVLIIKCCLLT